MQLLNLLPVLTLLTPLTHTATNPSTSVAYLGHTTTTTNTTADINTRSLSADPDKVGVPCWKGGSSDVDDLDYCWCWDAYPETHGEDRKWLIDAMLHGCTEMTGWVGEPVAEFGLGAGLTTVHTYWYAYNTNNEPDYAKRDVSSTSPHLVTRSDRKIALTIQVQQNFDCMGPLPVSWDYCWDMLRLPLDNCDTSGENDKHGGYMRKGCVWFVVDPNPDAEDHWPYNSIDFS